MPRVSMNARRRRTPCPLFRLVNTNGRSPRILRGIALHHLERGADVRREVDLVDDQQIRLGDARPALARDLVAGSDVDHVEREVGQAPG